MSNLNITYKNITGKRTIEHLRVELTTPQHILAIRAIKRHRKWRAAKAIEFYASKFDHFLVELG